MDNPTPLSVRVSRRVFTKPKPSTISFRTFEEGLYFVTVRGPVDEVNKEYDRLRKLSHAQLGELCNG